MYSGVQKCTPPGLIASSPAPPPRAAHAGYQSQGNGRKPGRFAAGAGGPSARLLRAIRARTCSWLPAGGDGSGTSRELLREDAAARPSPRNHRGSILPYFVNVVMFCFARDRQGSVRFYFITDRFISLLFGFISLLLSCFVWPRDLRRKTVAAALCLVLLLLSCFFGRETVAA